MAVIRPNYRRRLCRAVCQCSWQVDMQCPPYVVYSTQSGAVWTAAARIAGSARILRSALSWPRSSAYWRSALRARRWSNSRRSCSLSACDLRISARSSCRSERFSARMRWLWTLRHVIASCTRNTIMTLLWQRVYDFHSRKKRVNAVVVANRHYSFLSISAWDNWLIRWENVPSVCRASIGYTAFVYPRVGQWHTLFNANTLSSFTFWLEQLTDAVSYWLEW